MRFGSNEKTREEVCVVAEGTAAAGAITGGCQVDKKVTRKSLNLGPQKANRPQARLFAVHR